MRVALSINGVAVVVLGLMPGALLGACLNAIKQTLVS
jgi:NADH-quinone oxidoreductase subunit N